MGGFHYKRINKGNFGGDDGTILCALRVMTITQLLELYSPLIKQIFLCINFNF